MKRMLIRQAPGWALLLCLASPLGSSGGQFVELTAEIEIHEWDYWFFCDQIGKYPGQEGRPSIFTQNQTRRCIVGEGTWMIEGDFPTFNVTHWFTGTNIISLTLGKEGAPELSARKTPVPGELAAKPLPAGHRYTTTAESSDGNPGRPGGVADLMGFDLAGTISWLAFCSGPALKREGREIFPPSAFWKESSIAFSAWKDATEVFQDGLGLPRHINLVFTNNQSIFQYQVRQSTNVLGWNFPLEFYGVQYLPTGTNNWKLHLTLRGRVTSIGAGREPEIPADAMKPIQK
jgi:hypothetical protein